MYIICNKLDLHMHTCISCDTVHIFYRYGEQETKLTVECETEDDTSIETDSDLERQFNAENDPHQLELMPTSQFLQRPTNATSSLLYTPSSSNILGTSKPVSHEYRRRPSTHSRQLSTYSCLQSVRHAVMNDVLFSRPTTTDINESDVEENDYEEKQDYCRNRYLNKVCNQVRSYFNGIKKISAENNVATFALPKMEAPLSEIFKLMEQMKDDPSLHIVSYSVSQSNLEQVSNSASHCGIYANIFSKVFSHFVREQKTQENTA